MTTTSQHFRESLKQLAANTTPCRTL